ncbi:MAG: O-antigen ligase family protein [Planctomycetales bacterium]
MDFFLFLILNVLLIVRPMDMSPELRDLPLYNIVCILNLLVALPQIAESLRFSRLVLKPTTACVLGLLVTVPLASLSHLDTWNARSTTVEYGTTLLYYVLLIAVVNTYQRWRQFVYFVAILITITSTLSILHYEGYITISTLSILQYNESLDPDGEKVVRLRAIGLFNDPNDLAAVAVAGMVISLCGLGDRRLGGLRLAWCIPLVLLMVTLAMTKSRGGMIAFALALALLSYTRYGIWKTALLGLPAMPVALLLFAKRMTDFSTADSSAVERMQLWSNALNLFKAAPVLGIGMNQFHEQEHLVVHNSFLHCFTELGFVGGALFLGAFWFAVLAIWKLREKNRDPFQPRLDSGFQRMQPYCLGIVGGYATSLLSISRTYVIPTYLVLGLASAYCSVAQNFGLPTKVRINARSVVTVGLLSVAYLGAMYVYLRVTPH